MPVGVKRALINSDKIEPTIFYWQGEFVKNGTPGELAVKPWYLRCVRTDYKTYVGQGTTISAPELSLKNRSPYNTSEVALALTRITS